MSPVFTAAALVPLLLKIVLGISILGTVSSTVFLLMTLLATTRYRRPLCPP